jgi:hypothetical protein
MSSPNQKNIKKKYNNLMVLQNPTNIPRTNTSQYPYQNIPNNLINSIPSLNDNNFYSKNAYSANDLVYQNLQQRPNTYQQMRFQNNQGQPFVNQMSPYHKRINENDYMKNNKKIQQQEYARILEEQIKEKNMKKELEKRKKMQEELEYEEKIKREIEEENRKAYLEKQRELEQQNKNKKLNNENNTKNNNIINQDKKITAQQQTFNNLIINQKKKDK